MSATLSAAARYLGLVFLAGFVLGPVRILWLEPRLGATGALLVECVPMLAVMWFVARWSLRRAPAASPLGMGLVALIGLLALESALAAGLGRPSPLAWPATPADQLGLALKLAFAGMPLVAAR